MWVVPVEYINTQKLITMDNSNNVLENSLMLVKNPYTGKHINVKPLFRMAFEFGESEANANMTSIKKKIEEVIRLISVNQFREECVEECVKDLTHNLYLITDMFEEMDNF